jgi:hypothetical protein
LIFEIDQNFKTFIQNLKDADENLYEKEFLSQFNHNFTVIDILGNEVPILPNGRSTLITKSDVFNSIMRAYKFITDELSPYLNVMY